MDDGDKCKKRDGLASVDHQEQHGKGKKMRVSRNLEQGNLTQQGNVAKFTEKSLYRDTYSRSWQQARTQAECPRAGMNVGIGLEGGGSS